MSGSDDLFGVESRGNDSVESVANDGGPLIGDPGDEAHSVSEHSTIVVVSEGGPAEHDAAAGAIPDVICVVAADVPQDGSLTSFADERDGVAVARDAAAASQAGGACARHEDSTFRQECAGGCTESSGSSLEPPADARSEPDSEERINRADQRGETARCGGRSIDDAPAHSQEIETRSGDPAPVPNYESNDSAFVPEVPPPLPAHESRFMFRALESGSDPVHRGGLQRMVPRRPLTVKNDPPVKTDSPRPGDSVGGSSSGADSPESRSQAAGPAHHPAQEDGELDLGLAPNPALQTGLLAEEIEKTAPLGELRAGVRKLGQGIRGLLRGKSKGSDSHKPSRKR